MGVAETPAPAAALVEGADTAEAAAATSECSSDRRADDDETGAGRCSDDGVRGVDETTGV